MCSKAPNTPLVAFSYVLLHVSLQMSVRTTTCKRVGSFHNDTHLRRSKTSATSRAHVLSGKWMESYVFSDQGRTDSKDLPVHTCM